LPLPPRLSEPLFWICVAVLAVGQLAVIHSVLTGRSPGAATAERARRMRPGEIAWTLIPAVMLVVVLVFTWRAVRAPIHTHSSGEGADVRASLTVNR
jgi:heme/copper-type cytochrome/quinol oxidase subunit 2